METNGFLKMMNWGMSSLENTVTLHLHKSVSIAAAHCIVICSYLLNEEKIAVGISTANKDEESELIYLLGKHLVMPLKGLDCFIVLSKWTRNFFNDLFESPRFTIWPNYAFFIIIITWIQILHLINENIEL